jgi:hypothetical protein
MDTKQKYVTPRLVQLGTVADLTRVGRTNPGSDTDFGSVLPPGHVNKNNLGW